MEIEILLRKVMGASENITIPLETVHDLCVSGLVVKRYCSDGNYIELTDKGHNALRPGPLATRLI